jgi:hypothetical protein
MNCQPQSTRLGKVREAGISQKATGNAEKGGQAIYLILAKRTSVP